ncbi:PLASMODESMATA CALLOSE-BINDING PROTEIN 2 [Zea mays]|uniref:PLASMODESMATA CALLOSE-BINDING PROTEIN 2 n=1 Tax=Zea mays TaxID=4577 RepID=A0A1D6M9R7_MAIZE|nr:PLASMODESMATA CALLOSE-BINDING PROTEIN 2 [Zea mays]
MAVPLLLLLLLSVFTASDAAFCVCKPGMSDQMMQSAIDYACSKGADCASTTKGAPCYGNGNKVAVCSYICNSYYQSRSGTGAGAGTGAGMGAGAGTGAGTGMGAGTGTSTGAGAGTGTGAGITTPGALSPPFGGTGAYGPSGAGSTDYNDAAARRVSRLHVVAALVFGLAAAAAPLLR